MLDQRHKSFLTYLGSHPLKHFLSHIIHFFLSFTFSPLFYFILRYSILAQVLLFFVFHCFIFPSFFYIMSLFFALSFLFFHYFIHFYLVIAFLFSFKVSELLHHYLSRQLLFVTSFFLSLIFFFFDSFIPAFFGLFPVQATLRTSLQPFDSLPPFCSTSAFLPFSKKYTFSPSLSRLPIFDLSLLYLFHHSLPPSTAKHAVTHSLVTFTYVSLTSL